MAANVMVFMSKQWGRVTTALLITYPRPCRPVAVGNRSEPAGCCQISTGLKQQANQIKTIAGNHCNSSSS